MIHNYIWGAIGAVRGGIGDIFRAIGGSFMAVAPANGPENIEAGLPLPYIVSLVIPPLIIS
jgi:hypothetical protein